jgi:hypothetical protein
MCDAGIPTREYVHVPLDKIDYPKGGYLQVTKSTFLRYNLPNVMTKKSMAKFEKELEVNNYR